MRPLELWRIHYRDRVGVSVGVAFEELKPGARVKGLDAGGIAEVVQAAKFGADALNLVYRVDGRVGERLVFRGEENAFELVAAGQVFGFDADGGLLRLATARTRSGRDRPSS
ncbi:MAG TPA: hypothetical protein VJS38_11640 [Phenylobacterium sp.]|uniref:hypothetical protein n=1 Tax=Phenylobacterium sp. TaxID=1871053 RepID=UPI002B4900EB|nr:hypothetical protein [Phenylobacterium sp.]HKR88816.1 hypothetical protein [Phenylobacterium sp.]